MDKTYIELNTYIPFVLEYMFIDDLDISIVIDLLQYYKVPYKFMNLVVNNSEYPQFIIRDIVVPSKRREDVEHVFDLVRNKLKYKYKDFDDYYKLTVSALEEVD